MLVYKSIFFALLAGLENHLVPTIAAELYRKQESHGTDVSEIAHLISEITFPFRSHSEPFKVKNTSAVVSLKITNQYHCSMRVL